VFTSAFWGELFKLAGVQLRLSTAFHLQTDGQSEVTNRILGVYLRLPIGDHPRSWLRWLPWAEYCYNTSFQTALKSTPFKVVYGRDPPAIVPYQPGIAKVLAVDRQLQDRDEFLVDIYDRLLHAQEVMREEYNRKHCDVEFAVGNWVWLRLHQLLAAAITDKSAGKLAPKFYGPFRVEERIGPLAYRLALPPRTRIHPVFHVVFLKKFVGEPPVDMVQLPPIRHGRALPVPCSVAGSFCSRCYMGNAQRFQAGVSRFSAQGRAVSRRGGKCCGRLCWSHL
jgi:hypothetical protein